MTQETGYYCSQRVSSTKGQHYTNFYRHPDSVVMCGAKREEVVRVRLRERTEADPPSDYWGWLAADRDYYSMIWPALLLLEVCFAGGLDNAEARGQGRRVNLIVIPEEAT